VTAAASENPADPAATAAPDTSRAGRRRATEKRILDRARELFAERGFDRTTIRAVAIAADVDPALVMRYFGSKRELFGAAVKAPPTAPAVGGEALVDQLLTTLGLKLGGLPDATLAMLRSMLTDPASADHARAALGHQITAISAALPPTPDTDLRAALVITTLVGVTVGHQLLALDALHSVPTAHIAAALRPALKALTDPAG
jgi:AcrR family transcriptional regulator